LIDHLEHPPDLGGETTVGGLGLLQVVAGDHGVTNGAPALRWRPVVHSERGSEELVEQGREPLRVDDQGHRLPRDQVVRHCLVALGIVPGPAVDRRRLDVGRVELALQVTQGEADRLHQRHHHRLIEVEEQSPGDEAGLLLHSLKHQGVHRLGGGHPHRLML
jgi:hypothetical protein